MEEKQKAITKHVKQPDSQQLKSVYVWGIVGLASALIFVFGLWRFQIMWDAKELKEVKEQSARDLAECNAKGIAREQFYSDKIIEIVQDAKEEVIDRVMPEVAKREKRATIIKNQYSKIIPTQHKVKKYNAELNKELNKIPH